MSKQREKFEPIRPQTTESDDRALTRIDRYMIAQMLSDRRDHLVPLTPDTVIGGATLRQIMRYSGCNLYLDLKPNDPMESILVGLLTHAQRAAVDCFNEATRNTINLNAREINLRYALKASDVAIRLFQQLAQYRAEQAEQVIASLVGQVAPSTGEPSKGRSLARPSRRRSKALTKLNGNGQHP